MALTKIPLTAGANGYTKLDGTLGSGPIQLIPTQEVTENGGILFAAPIAFTVTNGQFTGSPEVVSGASVQYVVTEMIAGAKNPPPYVVTANGESLDLSTASRGPVGPLLPQYLLASRLGQEGGPAGPLTNGVIPAGQLPASASTALWQVAETYAGLSDPDALTEYPDNDPDAGITLDSGTYENFDFVCSELILPNDNTVLRNCRITTSNDTFGVRLDANTGEEVGRYLEHCQITAAGVAMSGAGFTARLVEVVNNGDDSARIGRSHAEPTVLELCYFHDFRPAAGAHADGVQLLTLPAADLVVIGCSVRMDVAPGYTVPPATGFTAAVFTDPGDVAVPDDDPEPTRVGNVWVDGCLLFSADNFSLVVNGSPDGALPIGTDVRNSTLLPGTTAIAELNTAVTGANNVDVDGVPLVDIGIHSDPRSRYLTVGDPRQSGGGGGFTPVVADELITSGSIMFPNTGGVWLPLNHADGTTPLEKSVAASAGDRIWVSSDGLREIGNAFDYCVMVGSTQQRYFATRTSTPAGDGNVGWYSGSGGFTPLPGRRSFVVTANDLDGGVVRIAMVTKGTGTGRIFGGADDTFYWSVENVGPTN